MHVLTIVLEVVFLPRLYQNLLCLQAIFIKLFSELFDQKMEQKNSEYDSRFLKQYECEYNVN